jgi:phosphosulfolactate synthase
MVAIPPDLATVLGLPHRQQKPRLRGLTIALDGGLPCAYVSDLAQSVGDLIDLWKFGWGTALVTKGLGVKIEALRRAGIDFFFGGTLFEKFAARGRLDEYRRFCRDHGCRHVEVSNGTIALTNEDKGRYVEELAEEFCVLSEVGYKDPVRSAHLSPADWARFVRQDLEAGARLVITESRESGQSGICDESGNVRLDVLKEIVGSGADVDRIVFEAPTKRLQTTFIRELGAHVNLANVAPADAVGLETLRLGLRSDTFDLTEEANSDA